MNRKDFLRRFGGLLLAAVMLPGMLMLSGTTAQARGFHGRRTVVIAPRIGFGPYRRGWYGRGWYYRPGYSYNAGFRS